MIILNFLNIGLAELILIIFALLFWVGLIVAIIFIVRSILKKKENPSINFPGNHYTVNVSTSDIGKPQTATTNTVSFKENEIFKIALPQQSEIRYVDISEIIRCEADDNYTTFVLDGENILVSRSLKEYADQLKPKGFLRTHQSHLVNPKFVKSWLKEDGGMLLLSNNEKIPVSKPNREEVKIALEN